MSTHARSSLLATGLGLVLILLGCVAFALLVSGAVRASGGDIPLVVAIHALWVGGIALIIYSWYTRRT
jgi:hypothetical protein